MSLVLDALRRARDLAQGRSAPAEAQNLMRSFGFSNAPRKGRSKMLALCIGLALVIGMAGALGYNSFLRGGGAVKVIPRVATLPPDQPVNPEPPPNADPPPGPPRELPPQLAVPEARPPAR